MRFFICGPSGIGKTTLQRILMDTIRVDAVTPDEVPTPAPGDTIVGLFRYNPNECKAYACDVLFRRPGGFKTQKDAMDFWTMVAGAVCAFRLSQLPENVLDHLDPTPEEKATRVREVQDRIIALNIAGAHAVNYEALLVATSWDVERAVSRYLAAEGL